MDVVKDCELFCTNVTAAVAYFDEFGFAVFKKGSVNQQYDERDHKYQQDVLSVNFNKEWEKIFCKWVRYKNGLGIKLLSLIKKGVPKSVRPRLWLKLLDVDLLRSSTEFIYQDHVNKLRSQLVTLGVTEYHTEKAEQELARVEVDDNLPLKPSEPSIKSLRQIFLDVARTFPSHIQFLGDSPEAIEGRASLFRILAIHTRFNPTVGYCQGMSFIAGVLCTELPEEDSFWCLVALLQKPKYLQGYFNSTLERVQRHARVFDRLLKQRQPDLWEHLHERNLDPLMYITPWFMCLFTSLPSWDCVLTIWDLMLLEGATIIFRVALAVMWILKPLLLSENDENALIPILQRLPAERVNRSTLLPLVWETNVHWWEIENIQAIIEDEEKNKRAADANSAQSSKSWRNVREKVLAQNRNESNLRKRLVKMFSGRTSKHCSYSNSGSTVPTILVSSPAEGNAAEPVKQPHGVRQEPSRGTCMTDDVCRIRRLVTGKREQNQSTESLGKVVDSLKSSAPSQKMAFSEFSHQIPLRDNQHEEKVIHHRSYSCSPETELKILSNNGCSRMQSPSNVSLKRRRQSRGTSPSEGSCTSLVMHQLSPRKRNPLFMRRQATPTEMPPKTTEKQLKSQ